MAYNEQISDRIREALSGQDQLEEKAMFGGVCYMVNGKMCMGVIKEELMCRIDPDRMEEALARPGCREMDFAKRPMKGYVYVNEEGIKKPADFQYWVALCLAFNPKAKAAKKKK